MEIMWDIPLSLNRWPNQHPDIYHVQPFYKPFEPKPQTTINLDPGWEFPSLPSEEETMGSPQKKEPFTIKRPTCFKNKKKKKVPNQRSEENKKEKKEVLGQRSEENKGKKENPWSRLEKNEKV